MKALLLALSTLAGASALGAAPPARADAPAAAFRWDSGVVLGTGRVWRGQLQTDGNPSLVGEVKLSHTSGFYTGIWAGTLDLGPGTDTRFEADYFAGWGKRHGAWSFNAGYLYRQRPSSTLSLDFQEVTASVAYNFGPVRPGLGVYHSWDYFQGGRSTYTYANLRAPLAKTEAVQVIGVATAGHQSFSNRAIGNYNDVDLRLIAKRGAFEYSLGYSETNVNAAQSGLLTRDKSGARWRAQMLVMF